MSHFSDKNVPWPADIQVYQPGSEDFTNTTLRWSIYEAPKFIASVTPKSEEEVVKIVKVAKASNIPSYRRPSRLWDTLAVGSCPGVGVIGVTVGAGVGLFQGLFGLMINNLISVRLITVNGDIVEASENANADLFWAIRASVKSAYFDVLQSFENNMPHELAMATLIVWDANSNAAMKMQIVAIFIYSGTEAAARQVLAPFFELSPPVLRAGSVPYSQVQQTILFGSFMTSPSGDIHDIFSVNVRKFAAETLKATFDKLDAFYKAHPDGRSSVAVLETFSNRARDAKGNFMFQMSWPQLGNRELRQDIVATSGYPELTVYVNHAHGDETLEQIYGKSKLPELVRLKKACDPDNVFKYHHALPTEYP
ncbi:hypothetical protein K449DRAFT_418890 [Hypoxylon sp. EC38]|nr:hypothetical protein K449DRAFT_418890 [Hypoxylon sp. EC38]